MISKSVFCGVTAALLFSSPGWHTNARLAAQQGSDATPAATAADPYVRYTTPGQCEQAAIRLTDQYWRDKRPDTVVYAPATDSVPAVAVQAARACGARFSVESVKTHELLDLAQLYLMSNQDDLARAAIDRLMASTAQESPVSRGWTLQLISQSYLFAKPTRLKEAQTYLEKLDALGEDVWVWRMFLHGSFARYAMSINDLETSVQHGKAAVAASDAMQESDRIDWASSLISAYSALADPVSIYTDGPAALAIMDRADSAVLPLRPEGSREQQILQASLRAVRSPFTLFGVPGEELTADHWFNTDGGLGTFPRSGEATLVVFANHSCGGPCYPVYAALRRLHEKFNDRGIRFVIVSSTLGFYRNRLQLPAEESDSIGKYFIDFLGLPGVVAVDESDFSKKPDGRRVNEPSLNARRYARGRSAVLIDKFGRIRLAINAVPNREKVLESAIESVLR